MKDLHLRKKEVGMSKIADPKDPKEILKQKIKENAYARKMNKQYEFLKQWNDGKLSGIECITAIEDEGKVFRIENDLIEANRGKNG